MGFMGWIGWFIAVLELVLIVVWWMGGAIDQAKADQSIADEAKQVGGAVSSATEKISALFKKKS
jgi:hypothetical protein